MANPSRFQLIDPSRRWWRQTLAAGPGSREENLAYGKDLLNTPRPRFDSVSSPTFAQLWQWTVVGALVAYLAVANAPRCSADETLKRPNILFAMADDWSWPHAGAYGANDVKTPVFDQVARNGILFGNAFAAAPQCSPNRASILTGRNIWQNEEAGTHGSGFPSKFPVFTGALEESGYLVGYTGKPWGPGNWADYGWTRNPVGRNFSAVRYSERPEVGFDRNDYAGNFAQFLKTRKKDQPFFFWYGCTEPHRTYDHGIGVRQGKDLASIDVPPFLPDADQVRSDIADYLVEVEWFDQHLGRMLELLEKSGEFDNTIVVVTSDNGMPFPRAKANLYEFGTHMPLAIQWPAKIQAGRHVEDLVSFIDFGPTFLEASGLKPLHTMTGRTFMNLLTSRESGRIDSSRQYALAGRERHTHARAENVGYPARSYRSNDYLYIWNIDPKRWPMGPPIGPQGGLHDIDRGPSTSYLIDNKDDPKVKNFYDWAAGMRPENELFDIKKDPGCLTNLADNPAYQDVVKELHGKLKVLLTEQKDPRIVGPYHLFDSYPRHNGPMRPFLGGFAEKGKYNPAFQ